MGRVSDTDTVEPETPKDERGQAEQTKTQPISDADQGAGQGLQPAGRNHGKQRQQGQGVQVATRLRPEQQAPADHGHDQGHAHPGVLKGRAALIPKGIQKGPGGEGEDGKGHPGNGIQPEIGLDRWPEIGQTMVTTEVILPEQ